eukprot:3115957-Pyramimonas_sp.AAC.1
MYMYCHVVWRNSCACRSRRGDWDKVRAVKEEYKEKRLETRKHGDWQSGPRLSHVALGRGSGGGETTEGASAGG